MIRRINDDIGRLTSGDVLRRGRGDRVSTDTESSSRARRGVNRSRTDPSVVEVSRVWDSAGVKPKGRFAAYHQFDPIPLGMYVDVYV